MQPAVSAQIVSDLRGQRSDLRSQSSDLRGQRKVRARPIMPITTSAPPMRLRQCRARCVAPRRRGFGLINLPGPRPLNVSTPQIIRMPLITATMIGPTLVGSDIRCGAHSAETGACARAPTCPHSSSTRAGGARSITWPPYHAVPCEPLAGSRQPMGRHPGPLWPGLVARPRFGFPQVLASLGCLAWVRRMD